MATVSQPLETLVSKKEVAEIIGVSEATLTRWIGDGTGPKFYRCGLFYRFKLSDINDWLEKRAGKPGGRKT